VDEPFPWEQREQDEGGTYFNPDTGKTQELPPGSGVTLGPPWIRIPDLPEQTYLSATASDTWVNQQSLDRHFDDHGDDFGARNEEDYAGLANKFYMEAEDGLPTEGPARWIGIYIRTKDEYIRNVHY